MSGRCGAGAPAAAAHQWWARGQWSSREEEDREKPARRERELGPAVSQASRSPHLLLLLLLPRAVEAKPPDARPRDLVLGLDQQAISVNTPFYF